MLNIGETRKGKYLQIIPSLPNDFGSTGIRTRYLLLTAKWLNHSATPSPITVQKQTTSHGVYDDRYHLLHVITASY